MSLDLCNLSSPWIDCKSHLHWPSGVGLYPTEIATQLPLRLNNREWNCTELFVQHLRSIKLNFKTSRKVSFRQILNLHLQVQLLVLIAFWCTLMALENLNTLRSSPRSLDFWDFKRALEQFARSSSTIYADTPKNKAKDS